MTWHEAKLRVLREIIDEEGLNVTDLSVKAGFKRNFLTRVFSGVRDSLNDDEIERMSPFIKKSVPEIINMAAQKKTATSIKRGLSVNAQAS